MGTEVVVVFKSSEDLAIALGFAGIEELLEEYDTLQQAVDATWASQDAYATVYTKED